MKNFKNMYKLIPPPSGINKLKNDYPINEQEDFQQIDVDDENLHRIFQNIQTNFQQENIKFLYNEIENACQYLSDKKIPESIPYFHQFQIIDIILNICNMNQIDEIIDILDTTFHLMYILTKNHYYLNIFPFDLIQQFLEIEIIYLQTDWYFSLLSNYISDSTSFNPFCINYIVIFIQRIQGHQKILNVLKFIEELSRFKFISKENPMDSNDLKQISQKINSIINFSIDTVSNKSPIVESASIILERLTRKKVLDLQSFLAFKLNKFVRNYYIYYPKFIKMIGHFIYNYGKFDIEFVMVASHLMNNKLEEYNNKYTLWVMYNMIVIDNNCLFDFDSENFDPVNSISGYIIRNIDSLPYNIKRQGILLILLMYSLVPVTTIPNEELFEKILDEVFLFCDDSDDTSMIENIFNFLLNSYKLIQISKDFIKSETLIPLFYQCKNTIMQVYLGIDEEKYTALQLMI